MDRFAARSAGAQARGRKIQLSTFLHAGLALFTLLALGLCLWLFFDISATHNKLELLLRRMPVGGTSLQDLQPLYHQEVWLDLLLGLISLVFGATVLGFITFYFQVVRRFRNIQSMDNHVLQSIRRGVLAVDDEGRVVSCNKEMRRILGLGAEEPKLVPASALFPPGDPILGILLDAATSESPEEREIVYPIPGDGSIPLIVTVAAIADERGRPVGHALMAKDMSSVRSLEERLRRQERLAALGNVVRRIVHEIRNPLSAMDLNLQLLEEHLQKRLGEKLEGKVQRYFQIVFSELSRLNTILEDTHLSVATPGAAEMRHLDIHKQIREIVAKMETEIRRPGHELVVDLAPSAAFILGDGNLLTQMFVNMIKNALEAMEGTVGKLIIRTYFDRKSHIVVEIQDSGRGVDWKDLHRIFDPYFTTKKKGTGLGLSIVNNILSYHHAEIEVGSWVGEGTLFVVRFPLDPGGQAAPGNTPRAS